MCTGTRLPSNLHKAHKMNAFSPYFSMNYMYTVSVMQGSKKNKNISIYHFSLTNMNTLILPVRTMVSYNVLGLMMSSTLLECISIVSICCN